LIGGVCSTHGREREREVRTNFCRYAGMKETTFELRLGGGIILKQHVGAWTGFMYLIMG